MDLLSNYGTVSNQIDTLWNIFMLAHVTLFAGLWKLDATKKDGDAGKPESKTAPVRRLGIVEWLGLLLAYAVFAYLNWNALRGDYNILDHLAQDIARYSGDDLKRAASTIRAIGKQKPLHRDLVVAGVHIAAAFFILLYSVYISSDRSLPMTWQKVKDPFMKVHTHASNVATRLRR